MELNDTPTLWDQFMGILQFAAVLCFILIVLGFSYKGKKKKSDDDKS